MPSLQYALEMHDVSKRFENLIAVSKVSFKLHKGSVHALLGENGAGKTTLMRMAFGMIAPDAGEIRIDGVRVKIRSPADAITAGIGMVHQHFMLAPAMTVAENVELGGRGRYRLRDSADRVRLLGEKTGLVLDPLATVSTLGIAAQQRLEIIKALARDAHTLILDEPTAILAPPEARELFRRIRALVLVGYSVVLITHKLQDAIRYADYVSVLRHGKLIVAGSIADFTEEALTGAMLGQPLTKLIDGRPFSPGEPVISLQGIGLVSRIGVKRLRDISMDVRAGEIVGIAALEGSATELLRILAGRSAPTDGRVVIPPRIGFIPEDRRDALAPTFNLYQNVAIKNAGLRTGRMMWKDIRNDAVSLLSDFDVRNHDIDMSAADLSGGNQQKLILARELNDSPQALIAENPTIGLDIQSSAVIHQRLKDAARTGCAVVVYSSDLDELAALADRVLVMRDGGLIPASLDAEEIGNTLLKSSPGLS